MAREIRPVPSGVDVEPRETSTVRDAVMAKLADWPRQVGELAAETGHNSATISNALSKLKSAGKVERANRGTWKIRGWRP